MANSKLVYFSSAILFFQAAALFLPAILLALFLVTNDGLLTPITLRMLESPYYGKNWGHVIGYSIYGLLWLVLGYFNLKKPKSRLVQWPAIVTTLLWFRGGMFGLGLFTGIVLTILFVLQTGNPKNTASVVSNNI